MFTREEKVILLEALKAKMQNTFKTLGETNNDEIKAKREKRIELLLSCKVKILNSKDVESSSTSIQAKSKKQPPSEKDCS